MIKQASFIVLLAMSAGLLTALFHPRAPIYRTSGERSPLAISLTEVNALRAERVLWIDARSEDEYATDHVPGAILLNEDDWETGFEALLHQWNPAQTLVVYCDEATCHASEAVAQRLRHEMSVESVYFLEGGWAVLREVQP